MRFPGRFVMFGLAVVLLSGCVTSKDITYDKNLKQLLDSLDQHNIEVVLRQRALDNSGIRVFQISTTTAQTSVSMTLVDARRDVVFQRLMAETGVTPVFNEVVVSGHATMKVDRVSLPEALKALFATQDIAFQLSDDVLVLNYSKMIGKPEGTTSPRKAAPTASVGAGHMPPGGPSPGPKPEGVAQTSPAAANPSSDGPAATPLTTVTVGGGAPAVITSFPFPTGIPTPQSSESYRLRFLDPDAAWALLDGLFPAAYAGRLVNFARQPERNGIFLSGTEDGVRQAAQILARADREQPTILLEALVIQFDTEAFEQLNMSLQNFQRRAISGLTTQIGEANGAALLFTHAPGIANPQIYTAIINALFQVDKARLVARPFVSTLSGKTALIDISGSRYVVVQQVQAGAAVIGTQAINSGVTMNITPTAVADGMIRVSLDILDSQFVPTSGNVAVAVAKHAVRSQVQIHDGQTIIIGGMTLLSRTNSNAGLPFLRLIPGLNLLFANQSATQRNQEVAIYVTPHIVEPGMNPSMISPEALSVPKNWKEQTVTPWEKLP